MARDHAECGTGAAYQRHIRRRETPDAACRKAWAAYHFERRWRTGECYVRALTEYEVWHLTGKSGDFL